MKWASRLATVKDVRVALAGVYREARLGKIDTQDATCFAYILNMIRTCIVDGEIEDRLDALESLVTTEDET